MEYIMELLRGLLGGPVYFDGHQIWPEGLLLNVLFALIPIAQLEYVLAVRKRSILGVTKFPMTLVFFFFFPNATYLAFEVKHLLFADGIADKVTSADIKVFGGLCLLGLALTTYIIVRASRNLPILKTHPKISICLMSVVAVLGAVLGLYDFSSLSVIQSPTTVAIATIAVVTNQEWQVWIVLFGCIIATLPLLVHYLLGESLT